MTKTFRPYEPDQPLLMPAALQDWLPEDHLVHAVSDAVDRFDLSEITEVYERETRGGPPYHPEMMVKVLVYGYCTGVTSSRKLARRLHEDVAFRMLAAHNTPDHRTIADFRKRHLGALAGLFTQVLEMCYLAGMVRLGHVSLDSTKIKANASKRKAMSYGRLKEKRAELSKVVRGMLMEAERVDEEEDVSHGPGGRGDELPEELAFKQSRLTRYEQAMETMEAAAREEEAEAESQGRRRPGVPRDRDQINFTGPESKIMPTSGGKEFVQGYNCHAVVDSESQVIVAARATNQTTDVSQTTSMMSEAVDNVGQAPREMSADAGYYSAQAVEEVEAMGVEAFIAPDRTRHGNVPPPAPRGRIPANLSPRDRMRRKLRTKRGRSRYALRMTTAEPPFGQIKECQGFRRFSMRGLSKADAEWLLVCTAHNLLKYYRHAVRMAGGGSDTRRSRPNGTGRPFSGASCGSEQAFMDFQRPDGVVRTWLGAALRIWMSKMGSSGPQAASLAA